MNGYDFLGKVISLCFDSAQHGALEDLECTLNGVERYTEDISAPLNVRYSSLSGVEVNTSRSVAKVNINTKL
jgi:hypothetical protein